MALLSLYTIYHVACFTNAIKKSTTWFRCLYNLLPTLSIYMRHVLWCPVLIAMQWNVALSFMYTFYWGGKNRHLLIVFSFKRINVLTVSSLLNISTKLMLNQKFSANVTWIEVILWNFHWWVFINVNSVHRWNLPVILLIDAETCYKSINYACIILLFVNCLCLSF